MVKTVGFLKQETGEWEKGRELKKKGPDKLGSDSVWTRLTRAKLGNVLKAIQTGVPYPLRSWYLLKSRDSKTL